MNDVVICGEQGILLQVRAEVLRSAGYAVRIATCAAGALAAVREQPPDVIILCSTLSSGEQELVSQKVLESSPELPVMVFESHPSKNSEPLGVTIPYGSGPVGMLNAVKMMLRSLPRKRKLR